MTHLHRADRFPSHRRCVNQHHSLHLTDWLCAPGTLRTALAIILVALCSWSHASQYRPDEVQQKALNAASWRATSLIGLRDAIPIEGGHSGHHVAQLWQQFQALPALHYAVNWSAPVSVYALYTGFNPDSAVITLTIGYLEDALLRPALDAPWARQLIPVGEYVNLSTAAITARADDHAVTPEASVRRGWQGLAGNRVPTAILERYHINADGTLFQAEVMVLYR